jgi:hypothetical protein
MKIDVSIYAAPNTGLDATAGLVQAIAAASPGDTLFFPNGEYLHTGLTISTADLTFDLERKAVLKKKATAATGSPLRMLAHGTRIYGGTIEDTIGNPAAIGVLTSENGVGYSLEMAGVTVKNARTWGIVGGESDMKLIDCVIKDSYSGGVYWNCSTVRRGPHVERVSVYKNDPSKYGNHGGIHIRSSGAGSNEGTKIRDCYVELIPFTNGAGTLHNDNVGIDCWQGNHASMADNLVKGGRIAYSLGTCKSWLVNGNACEKPGDYGYEFVDCHYGIMSGNSGIGFGLGVNRAIETSGTAAGGYTTVNRFGVNRFIGFSVDFYQGSGCVSNDLY